MAQNDCIDLLEPLDIRQTAGRWAFAEVEQEPLPAGLEQETGRALPADPRNEP
jgi:hypothetical protein